MDNETDQIIENALLTNQAIWKIVKATPFEFEAVVPIDEVVEKVVMWIQGLGQNVEYLIEQRNELEIVLANAPELNMSNYTDEQVEELNSAMIEVYQILHPT